MSSLTVTSSLDLPDQPVRVEGTRAHTIGRAPEADVCLRDSRVSRRHARLELRGQTWWLIDTSSSGTFDLSGERIHEFALDVATTVRLGGLDGVEVVLAPSHSTTDGGMSQAPERAPHPGDEPGSPSSAEPLALDARSGPITIGRDERCDIVIDDVLVSRQHAQLRRAHHDEWELSDLQSANGTFVDGARIGTQTLSAGARVDVGGHSFVFGQGELRPLSPGDAPALRADGVSVTTSDGVTLLEGVDLEVRAGTFTALVGPSGAGKSTLLRVLTGVLPPTTGTVEIGGEDLYRHYEHLRSRLGFVPQEDIVHLQLTVRDCLEFGAELRFPEDVDTSERDLRIDEVLEALGLSAHSDKPVSKLSGGQRKRLSVALELLTQPDLLFLDEPTTGLDPGYEQSTMQLLRRMADQGRAIVVVTHAVASLGLCDQVVFLGSGGWLGFVGAADEAPAHFGLDDFPTIFARLEGAPPPGSAPVHARTPPPGALPGPVAIEDIPYPNSAGHQFVTLVRRQIAVLRAERRGVLVMLLAAVIPASLLAVLIGPNSLVAGSSTTADARMLVGAMVVTVGVIGAANGVREIVKELPMYRRERAAGLRRPAYLLSKLVVFGVITAVQAAVVVAIATSRAGGPGSGVVLPGRAELLVDLVATGVATLAIGLLVSATVSSSEKAVAAIPILFVVLWLFSGTVSDLGARPVLREVALASPSSWGMAASAGTVDLLDLESCNAASVGAPGNGRARQVPCDARWERSVPAFATNLVALALLTVLSLLAADAALARKEPLLHMRRQHLVGTLWRRVRRQVPNTSGGRSE